jgi:hypothetical protein
MMKKGRTRTQADAVALLKDTVDFYSRDPESLRAYVEKGENGFGECLYRTRDGRCCAVGRHLRNPEHTQQFFPAKVVSEISYLETRLQPQSRGFPLDFWVAIQVLHDDSNHWTKKGISYKGKRKVDQIRKWIRKNIPVPRKG